ARTAAHVGELGRLLAAVQRRRPDLTTTGEGDDVAVRGDGGAASHADASDGTTSQCDAPDRLLRAGGIARRVRDLARAIGAAAAHVHERLPVRRPLETA